VGRIKRKLPSTYTKGEKPEKLKTAITTRVMSVAGPSRNISIAKSIFTKKQLKSQCDVIAICFVRSICVVGLLGLWTSISIHRTLYNGSCCDMTFSAPQFLEIPWIDTKEVAATDESNRMYWCSTASPNTTHNPHNYRLLQFYDARDMRFQQYSSDSSTKHKHFHVNTNQTTMECPVILPITNPGTPLLYIHGHWGSYEQSRSLGAHGINLTQSQIPHHKLQRHLQKLLHSTDIYDVYTLDYHREGGALHSYRLWEQAAIIEDAVRSIVHRVTLSQRVTGKMNDNTPKTAIKVTIVAHSIGGMVARAAFLPRGRPTYYVNSYVSTLITLATPHTSLPIAMDESVHKFYDAVNSYWKENSHTLSHVALISISGGYRDEMIHPRLCSLDDYTATNYTSKNSLSILASALENCNNIQSKINANHKSIIGMDHQAIVWCHHILSSIRTIIYLRNTSNNDNNNNMDQLRDLLHGKQKDKTSNTNTTFAISLTESTQVLYVSKV
jgi:pimeloyl-ACP methyl ester carboxylesterase